MRPDVESGLVVLDPYRAGNVCDEWIGKGYIWHCHARAAVPNNPKNIWGRHPDGRIGRGIQYPFTEPAPGEYHSDWDEAKLEPWKEGVRHLLAYHARHDASPLGQISTEFIPGPNTPFVGAGKQAMWSFGTISVQSTLPPVTNMNGTAAKCGD